MEYIRGHINRKLSQLINDRDTDMEISGRNGEKNFNASLKYDLVIEHLQDLLEIMNRSGLYDDNCG
jgi:hypothetical protein